MRIAPKLHSVKHGKKQELSAPSTTISAGSRKAEVLNKYRRTPQYPSTNSTRLPLHRKRTIGRRSTKGVDGGRPIRRLEKLYKAVRNCYKLSSVALFNGSLARPGVQSLSHGHANISFSSRSSRDEEHAGDATAC